MIDKDIFCPHGLAKRLKELGLNHPSKFYYIDGWKDPRSNIVEDGQVVILGEQRHQSRLTAKIRGANIDFTPAYLSCEIGSILPNELSYLEDPICLTQLFPENNLSKYEATYIRYEHNSWDKIYSGIGKSEVESRAKLLISLIEDKIISVGSINLKECNEEESQWL